MSRTDPQFKLRMPPALRAQVEQAAEQANRSLNAEIVTRLQASFTQVKPEVSANEKPEPVPAPTPRRELRLLCLLAKPQLDTAQGAYLPIHTMHRLPPRAMVRGQWSQPRYAGLYLRETQAREPSAEVLERCLQQRYLSANGRVSVLRVSA